MRIQLGGVSHAYPDGTRTLRQVDLDIPAGASVALLGPNGAGKTTLARLISGLVVPTEGTVWIGELDTASVPASRVAARVGFLFQDPRRQLFASSVFEEVAFGPRNLGWEEGRVSRAVDEALELVGMRGREADHPYELSLGEMRWLALASVLAMQTPVVILDEPTASLDGSEHDRLLGVLERLRAGQVTVLAVTHDMEFAAEHFPRLVCLAEGRVIRDGAPREVFAAVDPPGLSLPCSGRVALRKGLPRSVCREDDLLDALGVCPPPGGAPGSGSGPGAGAGAGWM